jgi:hypothetical protein
MWARIGASSRPLTAMNQQIWLVFGSIVMTAVPVPFERVDGGGISEADDK